MALIDEVKPRLGIFYSDADKNTEIQNMIDGAIAYFCGAGWDLSETVSDLGREAVILYCKMAQSTDPSALSNSPMLISYIAQGRAEAAEEENNA